MHTYGEVIKNIRQQIICKGRNLKIQPSKQAKLYNDENHGKLTFVTDGHKGFSLQEDILNPHSQVSLTF